MTSEIIAPLASAPSVAEAPLFVGLGGTSRPGSSSERILRHCLDALETAGARVRMFAAQDLDLPMYAPHEPSRAPQAQRLIAALREADGVLVSSPGYHGGVSGLIKNALDYVEDMRGDPRVYLDGRVLGCVVCANGWQAAVGTLSQLRDVGHALRAWPTPLGVAINSADAIWGDGGSLATGAVTEQLAILVDQMLGFTRAQRELVTEQADNKDAVRSVHHVGSLDRRAAGGPGARASFRQSRLDLGHGSL